MKKLLFFVAGLFLLVGAGCKHVYNVPVDTLDNPNQENQMTEEKFNESGQAKAIEDETDM